MMSDKKKELELYVYYRAEDFLKATNEKQSFESFIEKKKKILDGKFREIEKYGGADQDKEKIEKVLKEINAFQKMKDNELNQIADKTKGVILEKINLFTKEALEKAFAEAIRKAGEGVLGTNFNNVQISTNMKKQFEDNGGISNQNIEDAINEYVKQLADNILNGKINLSQKDLNRANQKYGYQSLKEFIASIQDPAYINYVFNTSQNYEKQLLKGVQSWVNEQVSISDRSVVQQFRALVNNTKKNFQLDASKLYFNLPTTILSTFQETLLQEVFSKIEGWEKTIVTGQNPETHIERNIEIEMEKGGKIKTILTDKTVKGKNIKTDVSIKFNDLESKNPINISAKYYNTFNSTNSPRLEEMTIMKILKYDNKNLNIYNNFLVKHEDESAEYKSLKKKILWFLSAFMIMRASAGVDFNGSIKDNATGASGLLIIQDNQTGTYDLFDLNKHLKDLLEGEEGNEKINGYIRTNSPLNEDTYFSNNTKEIDASTRNEKVLTELNKKYREVKYDIIMPINQLQRNGF